MALSKLTTDMNIISALATEPNDVGGLTAAELKAKFDAGPNAIKAYINDTLTSEIDAQKATKAEVQGITLGQIPDGTITDAKLDTALAAKIDGAAQVDDLVDTAINLSDSVKTALALNGTKYVSDALLKLSGVVNPLQYVWDKYSYSESTSFGSTANYDFIPENSENPSLAVTVYYADAYVFLDGKFTLVNPQTISFSYNNASSQSTKLQNKYFFRGISNASYTLQKGTATGTLSNFTGGTSGGGTSYHVSMQSTQVIVTFTQNYIGEVVDWKSDAYPTNAVVGAFRYIYKGRPQYIDVKIATGSYTGTGTYGSGNQNSLTFSFTPKIVIVYGNSNASLENNGCKNPVIFINPSTTITISYANTNSGIAITWGSTVSWYSSAALQQLNSSGATYYYLAIG